MSREQAGGQKDRGPRIALVHATQLAIAPAKDAFAAQWPDARLISILDDSLLDDLDAAGRLEPGMYERFAQLTLYARRADAAAILFTCSAFGEAIEHAARSVDIPVLKPNDAMFEAALKHGSRICLLATSQPAIASLQAEFHALAKRLAPQATLRVVLEPGAMAALQRGDVESHNRLLAERAAGLHDCDAIMLAHFSTARAAAAVRENAQVPVLAAPDCAVAALKTRLGT